jgi:hypothetical protein
MAETDYMKAFSDVWASTGNAVTAAQQQMFKEMTERMGRGFMFPLPAFALGGADRGPADAAVKTASSRG